MVDGTNNGTTSRTQSPSIEIVEKPDSEQPAHGVAGAQQPRCFITRRATGMLFQRPNELQRHELDDAGDAGRWPCCMWVCRRVATLAGLVYDYVD